MNCDDMTKAEYAEYEKAVEDFLSRNHVKPGCHGPKCSEGSAEQAERVLDPFFSWRPCDCCASSLGGNRETYQFAAFPHVGRGAGTEETYLFEADICTDCVYFLTYGRLDDQTMSEMETA